MVDAEQPAAEIIAELMAQAAAALAARPAAWRSACRAPTGVRAARDRGSGYATRIRASVIRFASGATARYSRRRRARRHEAPPRQSDADGRPSRPGSARNCARRALPLACRSRTWRAALRIRRVYLEALEEGRLRDLPAPAYAVGFVRTYARALGLDADEMVRRFREAPSGRRPQDRPGLPRAGARPRRAGRCGGAGRRGAGGRRLCRLVQLVRRRRAATVDAVPPLPPRSKRGRRPPSRRRSRPARRPRRAPPQAMPARSAVAARPHGPARPGRGHPAGAARRAAPPPPRRRRRRPRSRASCCAPDGRGLDPGARHPGGPVLVNRVLRPGETWPVPGPGGLLLSTGSAEGSRWWWTASRPRRSAAGTSACAATLPHRPRTGCRPGAARPRWPPPPQ